MPREAIISVPFAGTMTVVVDLADGTELPTDPYGLLEMVWDAIEAGEGGVTMEPHHPVVDVEWDTHARLVEGNVTNFYSNEIEVIDIEEAGRAS